jgi:hypothetical protein
MQKNIAICLLILACTFSVYTKLSASDEEAIEFLQGFSSVFGLSTACNELVQCANQSAPEVFTDLKLALTDLEKKNITGAIDEMIEFFKDIEDLKDVCNQGVQPYLNTFGAAMAAYKKNKAAFDALVVKNLASQPAEVLKDTIQLAEDLKSKNYTSVGVDFGHLTQIGLQTWLNSSTEQAGFLAQ